MVASASGKVTPRSCGFDRVRCSRRSSLLRVRRAFISGEAAQIRGLRKHDFSHAWHKTDRLQNRPASPDRSTVAAQISIFLKLPAAVLRFERPAILLAKPCPKPDLR